MSVIGNPKCRIVLDGYDYEARIDPYTGDVLVSDADEIYCHGGITHLNLSRLINLSHVSLESCEALKSIRLTLPNLTSLEILSSSLLTQLDVSSCPSLRTIKLETIPLVELSLVNCAKLRHVNLINLYRLQRLTLGQHQWMECLIINGAPRLHSINLFGCTSLKMLSIANVGIKLLDLSSCSKFEELHCSKCPWIDKIIVHTFNDLFIQNSVSIRVVGKRES